MLEVINHLYKESEYSDIVKSVNGLNYPFDDNWDKIAIAISGGADSALLSYILCNHIHTKNLKTSIFLIHNIRCWKSKPWQKYVADQIIFWLKDKFPNLSFSVQYNFVPPDLEHSNTGKSIKDEYGKLVSGDTIELRSFAEYVCHTYDIKAYFNAITKNPNISLENEIESRNIEPKQQNFRLAVMKHQNFLACHPFRFVDKSWIISSYEHLQINDLLKITRSCEGEFHHINYKNYVPGQYIPVCNNCFWCKEREWGIDNAK